LAYAFRVEQFLVWYPYSNWKDIFRVDTLNCIAACSIVIGLFSVTFKTRKANMIGAAVAAAMVILTTPFVYPMRPSISPLMLSYFNGNGNPAAFSVFPWVTFALAGTAFGFALLSAIEAGKERKFFWGVGLAGVSAYCAGRAMSWTSAFEYGFFDYSLTSPHFVLVRMGLLALILFAGYMWCTRFTLRSFTEGLSLLSATPCRSRRRHFSSSGSFR
jgi:hypothetical protein